MPATALDDHVLLDAVTKQFGSTRAVDSVVLAVRRGECHALIGENGAGKSTLGKIIAGVHEPDDGSIAIDGQEVRLRSPRHALARGITMVAQELSLVPTRSVLENVYLGIESTTGPFVDDRRHRQRFQELIDRTRIRIDPDRLVRSLGVADQQKVEILRALARDAELIVMDEPTARLSTDETADLLAVIHDLRAGGTTIVFVSHLLDQVLAIADRITVLRDGRLVQTTDAADETPASLVEVMIGRSLATNFPEKTPPPSDSPVLLTAEGLGRSGIFEDVSLSIRAGEIVALAGLVGSGRTEVVRAIFGADRLDSGDIRIDDLPVRIHSPGAAIARGIGMIPESRRDQGLMLRRSVRENTSLPHLSLFTRVSVVAAGRERSAVSVAASEVDLRGASMEMPVGSLSGGNQQKSLFARWMIDRPRILIADEPTRGVDVGAKRAIYELLATLAADGMGVLLVSSEIEEVLGLAHRILVMRNGRIVQELNGTTATGGEVLEAAFGTSEKETAHA